MITIDDLLVSRFLLARNLNAFYGRRIVIISDIKKVYENTTCEEYLIITPNNDSVKLHHNIKSGSLYVILKSIEYRIEGASNNFVNFLKEGDIMVYRDNISDNDTYRLVYAKVLKHMPKYKRFIVDILGTRHNLSTVLKEYASDNLIAIKTADIQKGASI